LSATEVYFKTKLITPKDVARVTMEVQLPESVVRPLAVVVDRFMNALLRLPVNKERLEKILCFRCARIVLPFRKVFWCLCCYALHNYLESKKRSKT